jgi:uncharacterized membrane protein
MKLNLKINKKIRFQLSLSWLISLLMLLATAIFYFRLQPQVPLFYSLARPEQYLTSKEWIFILPGLSIIMNLIHFFIAQIANKTNSLILQIFAWVSVGLEFILGLALLRILFIIS